jgi:putative sterol carrier protein
MSSLSEAFGKMQAAMAADSSLAAKVKGVLQFELGAESWTVDCSGAGRVAQGKADKADCTVTMGEKDFLALFAGKLNGMSAYMSGKMKVRSLCPLQAMNAPPSRFSPLITHTADSTAAQATPPPRPHRRQGLTPAARHR